MIHKWSRTNYCPSGEKEWILWRPSSATFLSSEVSSSPPFSLTRLSSTRVSPTMVFKCRNIAAFKFWGGNITIWSRKISWFFERYYQNHRSWEYFSRIFFNFRKSREIILKDILKSSFYIFIKIRWCLILEEFRKYQYKSWIYSKNSRECVCDKCDNILLTEITWANTWRGVLERAYS